MKKVAEDETVSWSSEASCRWPLGLVPSEALLLSR
jgi:hypothetical protein